MILNNDLDLYALRDILVNPPYNQALLNAIVGPVLGEGAFRIVHEYNVDPKCVLKIEKGLPRCNIAEYEMWREIKGLKGDLAWVLDWFVPVQWISGDGKVLCMRKTTPMAPSDRPKLPKNIPVFIHDAGVHNFGWYKGKWRCHDYGAIHGFTTYGDEMRGISW